jgi:hypothetical protein
MKFKSCTIKEMITELKRLPTDWEKILPRYICEKGLMIRT